MSTSSTTACSRSSSPATPEAVDNLDPAITQEVVNAWCHSLSQDGFYLHDEHFENDKERPAQLELGDLIQDDAYDDNSSSSLDRHTATFSGLSQTRPFPMSVRVPEDYRQRDSISSTKPIPPPSQVRRDLPTAAMQSVVLPTKESCMNLPIMFPSIPPGGTKSRVETQVRLTVDLAHASASSGEPLKYDRVGSWKWLRLPKGTSTKRRTRKEGKIDASPEDTLYLTTEVSCATPPHAKVSCCTSCQAREAKRIERKVAARIRPARSDDECTEDPVLIPGRGKHEDNSKLIQFNCPEVLDFSMGTVILPLRITCYCRHHREKTGFNVHFTMFDHSGRIVGSGVTRPIMITDDHKSTGVNKTPTSAVSSADATPDTEWAVGADERPMASDVPPSKRKTPVGANGERAKKRTKPYDGRRAGKLPRKGSTCSLNSTVPSFANTRANTPALSNGSSPSQLANTEPPTPEASDRVAVETLASLLSSFEPPHMASDNSIFDDIVMPDAQPHLQSNDELVDSLAVPSAFVSPEISAASPQMLAMPSPQSMDLTQSVQYLFSSDPSPPSIPTLPSPKIHRLIPASGPTYGGIEITVLGANFSPNQQLTCVFGEARSSSTHRWSDNTLVCLLPPSTTPGVVAVWFDGIQKEDDGSPPALFAYTDDTDRALMELALQVVGLKMTGRIEDARDVAMRIVNTTGPDNMNGTAGAAGGAMQLAAALNFSADVRRVLLSGAGNGSDLEKLVLDFLNVLDTPLTVRTHPVAFAISHQNSSGQTLLHLATFLGFTKIVDFLIKHTINLDARDKNGYTALHFAALTGSAPCARLLVEAGAALDIANALNKTPAEIAPAGLFEDLFIADPFPDDASEVEDSSIQRDEEADWGDVEEAESDDGRPVRVIRRRRSDRKLKDKSRAVSESSGDEKKPLAKSSKKAKEPGLVDEKQLAATIMDMFQKTFAQLQHPQDIMPNLPLHMPAWGALPQMPAVFPVYVPIPAFWGGDRHRGGDQSSSEEGSGGGKNQQWLGIPSGQEWKAFWDRWILAARSNEEAPPAYTPRDEPVAEKTQPEFSEDKAQQVSATSTATQPAQPSSSSTVMRRVNFDTPEVPISEEEVKSFGYRPARKQTRKTQHVKHDRMLVLFWIPILLIGLFWAFMHSMRVGFHAVKALVSFKAAIPA